MDTSKLNIMFKIATRQRPAQFEQLVLNIISKCKQTNYFILVSADIDDALMYNNMVHEFCSSRGILLVYGPSKNKVDAINRDIYAFPSVHWDILVNVSDDMRFIDEGFDIDIRREFHDSLDWFVHFPDNNRKDICTMSVLGRQYYERHKNIYYPGYNSVCCDKDATEQAQSLGRYRFVDKTIANHNHPAYKSGEWDALYARNESEEFYKKDNATLAERRRCDFKH